MPDPLPDALKPLAALAAQLGTVAALAHGVGAYVSLKHRDQLWINGYGTALAQAASREIFLPMDLGALVAAAHRERVEIEDGVYGARRNSNTMMPAPDAAALHALMPQRVVLQVLGINTLAHGILADGPERIAARLAGLASTSVPYSWWAEDLAVLAREALGDRPADIVVLQGRGLMVGADSEAAAATLLQEVEARLALPMRALPEPDLGLLQDLAAASALDLPQAPEAHASALDAAALALTAQGPFHHDQAILLGSEPPAIVAAAELADWLAAVRASREEDEPTTILIPGVGVLARRDLPAESHRMLAFLGYLMMRVPPEVPVAPLAVPADEERWRRDDEKHQRWIAQGRPR